MFNVYIISDNCNLHFAISEVAYPIYLGFMPKIVLFNFY